MRQAEPAQRRPDCRDVASFDTAFRQSGFDLDERDAGLGVRQLAKQAVMPVEKRSPITANLRRPRVPGGPHPLHQLDRRGRANLELRRRLADRTPGRDGLNDPATQILRQGLGHDRASHQMHRHA